MRKCLLILLLIALTLPAVAGTALAQEEEPKSVEDLYLEGRARYKARDFKGAIESFKSAYELERNPNFAYNIAKIYEKLRDWDNAIVYYNEFLVLPGIKEKDRKFALAKTKELEKTKQMESQKDQEKDKVKPPPEVDHTTSYVLMGTGGALFAAGAVMGVLSSMEQSTFEDSASTTQEKIDAKDAGQTYALAADIGMGLGVVSAGVGLVLYLMAADEVAPAASTPQKSDKTQSQVVPWVSPQGGGMNWTLRF